MVEVAMSRLFGPPQEAAVAQRGEIIAEVDPTLGSFGQQDLRLASRRIDREQVQPLLIAALALDVEGLTVLRPIDTRQINVAFLSQIDLYLARSVRLHDIEIDQRIGRPGG